MQFNSHATNDDIVSDIKFWLTGSATGTVDYAIEDITRNVNRRLDDVVTLIMQADGRWKFDDDNYTDLPIGSTSLVAGQQDYSIAAADFLNVIEVAVKKSDGKYQVLTPVDRDKGNAQFLTDFEDGSNGLPLYYDKIGNSIFLYPKPSSQNVTLADGLKVIFQRTPSYFTTVDTTKKPGFAPTYHRILSIGAAIDFCIANGMKKKRDELEPELTRLNQGLIAFYSGRSKDEQVRLGLQSEDYGGQALTGGPSGRVISENRFNI